MKQNLTAEQFDAILDRQGHEPCPGVNIVFKQSLGSAGDGEPLHATIFRPDAAAAGRRPMLLTWHGGGFQFGNPDGCGALAKILAIGCGMTTVSASYRLASETRATFPAVVGDAMHAWRWVQQNADSLNGDPARVAVSGESAGVLLAAHLAVSSPMARFADGAPRPAALVANWGPIDFIARWYDRGGSPGAERTLLGAGYLEDPALYHRASPLAHAIGPLPPALFVYGEQDRVVHPRQGQLGLAAWKRAGAYAELKVIPNIGHGTTGDNREARREWLAAARDFLAARLGLE